MREDASQLRQLLEKVLDRVPQGEDTGILLSGGVDSSSLASILLNRGQRLRSISASFVGWQMYDETEYVQKLKARYPNLETNFYTTVGLDLIEELKAHMPVCRHPLRTGTLLLQYQLFKMAQKLGIRNLIYGQYGDELFGGYDLCFIAKAYDEIKQGRFSDAWSNVNEFVQRERIQKDPYIAWNVLRCFVTFGGLANALRIFLKHMDYIVETSQKAADQFGIRLYLPYGEPEIRSFAQSLEGDRIVSRGQNKVILKEAVEDIVPPDILGRRKKFCFYAPDAVWLLQNRQQIESIPDARVQKEYKWFLRDPGKRRYYKLWMSLSGYYLNPAHR